MQGIWSEQNMFCQWLRVEIALCSAYRQIGRIPRSVASSIRSKASFDIERIYQLEKQGKSDMDAFLISVKESLDNDEIKFLHLGVSASDIKDTSLSLMIRQAGQQLDRDLDEFMRVLKELALEHKLTVCAARVHGTYSEPTSFGLKILTYYNDMKRVRQHLNYLINELCVGMFSGSNGAFTNLDTDIEQIACENLGIKPAVVSTQVLGRDRHASLINHIAVIGSMLERLAQEIRILQRPEIAEVEEPFVMRMGMQNPLPHKRTPWRSESVVGLARTLRSFTQVALENIAISHERDSSYNHSERVVLPEAFSNLDYMIYRMTQVMRGLIVFPKNMYRNLYKAGGVVFAPQISLRLIDQGMESELAYELVEDFARRAWIEEEDFKDLLLQSELIAEYLDRDQIATSFNPDYYLRNVDQIFNSVLGLKSHDRLLNLPSFAQ